MYDREIRYRILAESIPGARLQIVTPHGYDEAYKPYLSDEQVTVHHWALDLSPMRLYSNGLMPTVLGWIDSSALTGEPVIGVVAFAEEEAREVLWWMMQDERAVREFAHTARKEFKPRAFVAEVNAGKLRLHIPHPAWSWQRMAW
jgi:hypothetical protein